ncbi:damage-inducible protein CinA [Caldanaerobacter subterraneus subsp. yonseiensis KB-1]|uniref:Putative competence-damage inducible protein n=1 Tax=Caldanaerobacter subterraneus subsp. yonseiensis KB-1 TaxID=1388761 RepID=U5CTV4_CALSX|nr:competence/damage-inducible protein A [Caldanaerobacter subterraneus]ERM92346.1 damage-inducible protein CinA [Caldanaerobacter subterraneus subsp. yonseiensis KB-1]
MRGEIISVGTELLLGQIVNTNAKYLSERLALLGIDIYFHTNVGDNEERLKQCLKIAYERSELIITTGGLGPTVDDITKETIASFLNLPLVESEEAKQEIINFFERIGQKPTENNFKQALFPAGSKILPNKNGTAPGFILEKEGKIFVVLPGPPSELIPMFEEHVYPYLKRFTSETIKSRVLKIFGLGESKVEEMVRPLLQGSNPTVAPLVGDGYVTLRITAKGKEEEVHEMISQVEKKIREILGDYIYAVDDEEMEKIVIKLLQKRGFTLATAESCTGGLLAKKITDVPGASKVFNLGVVTYSNEAKEKVLGVKKSTLDVHGAVSPETAKEMAENVRVLAKSDLGLSTTGIAGPSGGSPEKPVGLVYVGFATPEKTYVKKLMLSGNRDRIRTRSILHAFDMVRRYLEGRQID